jgi:DNA-binding response OmpR family regulator
LFCGCATLNEREAAMPRILVVDDDRGVVRLLSAILVAEDYEVDYAYNGAAALDFLNDGHPAPDLILLDLKMPGVGGEEVFVKARRAGVVCPIVICSSYGAEAAAKELGAQGAITKPFEPESLLSDVRAQLASVV